MGTWYVRGYDRTKAAGRLDHMPVDTVHCIKTVWWYQGYGSGDRSIDRPGYVDPVHRPYGVSRVPCTKAVW